MIVIKIGGHLLFQDNEIRVDYLRELLGVLRSLASREKILVVVGGGVAARNYIGAGRRLSIPEAELDIIGIRVSRLNAALLHAAYYSMPPTVPENLEEAARLLGVFNPVFMGGLQPGQSTTTVAALAAEALQARLYIATSVKGIYSEDPRKNPHARFFREIAIDNLKKMFSRPSGAGGYVMLDPLTLGIIERSRIQTIVFKGDPPSNIERAVEKGDIGTLITF